MAEAEAFSMDGLPDGLLGQIMVLVGREHGRSLTLVSRRWRRVYLEEPKLWRSFTVRGSRAGEALAERSQRLEQQAALLRRVAPHVRCFRWEEYTARVHLADGAGLARCLSALQPGRLRKLQLCGPCPSAASPAGVSALQQLSSLSSITSLELGACIAPANFNALGGLSGHLRSLQLSSRELTPLLLHSIVQLAQLTALHIEAYDWPQLGTLTRLSQLKQLVLLDHRVHGDNQLQPPTPASFPAGLERFSYGSKYRTFQFAGHALYRFRLWQCKNVPLPTLSVVCNLDTLPLAQLLGTLQPAGAAPCAFQRLELHGSLPAPAPLAACTQLSQLRELHLVNVYAPAGSTALEQVLAVLLQQASQLSSLAVNCPGTHAAKLAFVPPCLASYRGLTSLALGWQGLHDLPPGEYLEGLQSLDIRGNAFGRLPPVLSSATALTRLTIDTASGLSMYEVSLAMLRALPRLRVLGVAHIASAEEVSPAMLHELQACLPNLSVVTASADRLD